MDRRELIARNQITTKHNKNQQGLVLFTCPSPANIGEGTSYKFSIKVWSLIAHQAFSLGTRDIEKDAIYETVTVIA